MIKRALECLQMLKRKQYLGYTLPMYFLSQFITFNKWVLLGLEGLLEIPTLRNDNKKINYSSKKYTAK
jgi:hypothetical protein